MIKKIIFVFICYQMNAQQIKMERFINLPLSNRDYQYSYCVVDNRIIEKNNHTGEEIAHFNDYNSFRDYYLNLNKRMVLPDKLEGLYASMKFLLSQNYINDKLRLLNLHDNIDYYLKKIDESIDRKRLNDVSYVNQLLNNLSSDISYQGSDKFEIPIIILIGEYFKFSNSNAKWITNQSENVLGEKFYYPELSVDNEEYDLYNNVRKVLYNEGDDKIFNFSYMLISEE